jgi:hypothetical protein
VVAKEAHARRERAAQRKRISQATSAHRITDEPSVFCVDCLSEDQLPANSLGEARRAVYDTPSRLCEYHWARWWAGRDPVRRVDSDSTLSDYQSAVLFLDATENEPAWNRYAWVEQLYNLTRPGAVAFIDAYLLDLWDDGALATDKLMSLQDDFAAAAKCSGDPRPKI